jgi:hypothetical protein
MIHSYNHSILLATAIVSTTLFSSKTSILIIGLELLYQNLIVFNHTANTSHCLVSDLIFISEGIDDLSHSISLYDVIKFEIFQYFSEAFQDFTHF